MKNYMIIRYLKFVFSRLKLTFDLVFGKYPDLVVDPDNDKWWRKKKRFKAGFMSEWQKKRFDLISVFIEKGFSIKDVGCGDASILINLMKNKDFKQVYGIDNSNRILEKIEKSGINTIYFDFLKDEDYVKIPVTDYTITLEFLEHTIRPEKILLMLLEKTNKKLIFSIPNTGFISHRLRLLLGSFPKQWLLNPSDHVRFWTYRDLIYWLKQLDLYKKSNIYFYEGIPVLNQIIPSLFAMGFIVTVDKEKVEKNER